MDLVELTGDTQALGPKTSLSAVVSTVSFCKVPVPCALT